MAIKQINVAEATGPALDWLVANVEHSQLRHKYGSPVFDAKTKRTYQTEGLRQVGVSLTPSTDWAEGGPIIELEHIGLEAPSDSVAYWVAIAPDTTRFIGLTPLIAAMRCYVTSMLGPIAGVPEELL